MSQGSPVEAVDRALLLLQALAPQGAAGATLGQLAKRTRLNKTTVHRTLAALRLRGFVDQDPGSGSYTLGAAATQLSADFYSEENLPLLLHPALVALSDEVDELVHLGVLSGTRVVYLDKVEPERPVRVWSAVGRTRPAVTTALGRALLAWRGTDRGLLAGYVSAALTEGEAGAGGPESVTVDGVWAELERARSRGWAAEVEENETGISCVAVPLLRAGSAVAAVSVTAPAERMSAGRRDQLVARVRELLPPLLPAGLHLPPG